MSYKINMINEKSKSNVKVQHNTGISIKLLPFTSRMKKDAMGNFKCLVGGYVRNLGAVQTSKNINREEFIEQITSLVCIDDEDKNHFKYLIQNQFFDENNELGIFHSCIFQYVHMESGEQKKFAQFIYSIFSNEEITKSYQNIIQQSPNNVLYRLMIEALPPLEKVTKVEKTDYKNMVPYVTNIFEQDFLFMLKRPKFMMEYLERIIKYYYFFYISQTVLKLNRFFEGEETEVEPLYFKVDWENSSQSRDHYSQGWDKLSKQLRNLFSHVVTLEFLNYIHESNRAMSYHDIAQSLIQLSEEELSQLYEALEDLIAWYKRNIGDVDWDSFDYDDKYSNPILSLIHKLYSKVHYQFMSNRSEAAKRYNQTFEEFCKKNFLKASGRLGYILNITEDFLIFMTRLCIKDQQKIRLKTLFEEFERRGLFFDRISKEKITQFYEKLNVLEKKSDSGDAQYVKAIL